MTRCAAIAAAAILTVVPAFARIHIPVQLDFHGVWAGNGSVCQSPDEFMLIYGRNSASFPFRGSQEPDRQCRIVSVEGKRPVWNLRLHCEHPDPAYRVTKPYTVNQTLRMSDDGMRMTVETEPANGQPARVEDVFYCRKRGELPPPLRCRSSDGRMIDCPP